MRTLSEVVNLLNIDPAMIRGWLDHAELQPFFSATALQQVSDDQRQFTDDDVLVLNTINELRRKTAPMTWPEVAAYLQSGQRKTAFSKTDTQMIKTVRIDYQDYEAAVQRILELERQNALLKEEVIRLSNLLKVQET